MCLYICMLYVCLTRLCMYVYVCVYVRVRVYVCMCVCRYPCMCTCVRGLVRACVFACLHARMSGRMPVRMVKTTEGIRCAKAASKAQREKSWHQGSRLPPSSPLLRHAPALSLKVLLLGVRPSSHSRIAS